MWAPWAVGGALVRLTPPANAFLRLTPLELRCRFRNASGSDIQEGKEVALRSETSLSRISAPLALVFLVVCPQRAFPSPDTGREQIDQHRLGGFDILRCVDIEKEPGRIAELSHFNLVHIAH